MNIQHDDDGQKGSFFVEKDGGRVAELQYMASGEGRMTIYHTEVDEQLRGQHIGDELVKAAVDHARAEGLKIVPQCPFARKVMERNDDYKALIAT
jgi:predicted GNAT family acetyltransferase